MIADTSGVVRKRVRKCKACLQCTKAKRKCDKTAPACKRCVERGEACGYQLLPHLPVRIAAPVAVAGGRDNVDARGSDESGRGGSHPSSVQGVVSDTDHTISTYTSLPTTPRSQHPYVAASPQIQPVTTNTDISTPATTTTTTSCCSKTIHDRWFLDPESWCIQQIPRPELALESPVSEETLPYFTSKLQEWLGRWVEDGHSPLMHRELHRGFHMPELVQDAFTALTAYRSATPTTKATIMRMINSRADKLVDSQPLSYLEPDASDFTTSTSVALDTLTHVSRTQALFIYQMIRLFDGDIRSRFRAEVHRDTLHSWACQTLASARLDCSGAALMSREDGGCSDVPSMNNNNSAADNNNNNNNTFPVHTSVVTTLSRAVPSDPPSLWRAWILAESVRRTYLMAVFMQGVYHNIKHNWSVCPGGAAFTARAGLWDAKTPHSWYKETRREDASASAPPGARGLSSVSKSLLLLESLDAWGVLRENKPNDVDEFTVAILEICYGLDLVENWASQMVGS